jgi:hypothetical protein
MSKRQLDPHRTLHNLTAHVAATTLHDPQRPSARHGQPRTAGTAGGAKKYDVVLAGGRVIDPASGTDAVLNVGIVGDRIVALGPASEVSPTDAAQTRDCTGKIVSPGFIDLHAHGQNNESAVLAACDGVTTHLELEVGTWPVESFCPPRARAFKWP